MILILLLEFTYHRLLCNLINFPNFWGKEKYPQVVDTNNYFAYIYN